MSDLLGGDGPVVLGAIAVAIVGGLWLVWARGLRVTWRVKP